MDAMSGRLAVRFGDCAKEILFFGGRDVLAALSCSCFCAAFNIESFCDKSNDFFSCALGYTMPMLKFLIAGGGGGFDVVDAADFRSTVLLIAVTSLTIKFGSGLVRLPPVNVIDSGECDVLCIRFGLLLFTVVLLLVIDRLCGESMEFRLIDILFLDSDGLVRVDGTLALIDGLLLAAIDGLPLALDNGLARALLN